MATVRDILSQAGANLDESMGVRSVELRPNLAPVSDPRDVGRRPLRNVGRVAIDQVVPDPDQPRVELSQEGLDRLAAKAAERAVSSAALALAWTLGQAGAIVVGPRRPEHLDDLREALSLSLSPEERGELGSLFG